MFEAGKSQYIKTSVLAKVTYKFPEVLIKFSADFFLEFNKPNLNLCGKSKSQDRFLKGRMKGVLCTQDSRTYRTIMIVVRGQAYRCTVKSEGPETDV